MAKTSKGFSLFLRYQAQAERQYRRALEEFERLKALQNELPNEPISDDQPQENTEPAPSTANPHEPSPEPVPQSLNPIAAPQPPIPLPSSIVRHTDCEAEHQRPDGSQ